MVNLARIPNLRDRVSSEEWRTRVDLAACYRLLARFGWTDLIETHTSVAVPGSNNRHFLINPHGMLFEQVTASSLIKVGLDGELAEPSDYSPNPAGFTIHSAIHMARPDAFCVMHTHTPAGMAVSMQRQGLLMASQHACFFNGNLGYHDLAHMTAGLQGREALGRDMGRNKALIMRSHGLLVCGRTIGEAIWLMQFLDRACAAQVAAGSTELNSVSDETAQYFGEALSKRDLSLKRGEAAWPSLVALLDAEDPSYRN